MATARNAHDAHSGHGFGDGSSRRLQVLKDKLVDVEVQERALAEEKQTLLKDIAAMEAEASSANAVSHGGEKFDEMRHASLPCAASARGSQQGISRSCSRSYSPSEIRSEKSKSADSLLDDQVGYSDLGNEDGDNGADFAHEKEDAEPNQPKNGSSAQLETVSVAAPASRANPNPLDDFFAERPIASPSKKDMNPPAPAKPAFRDGHEEKHSMNANGWHRSRSRGREGRRRMEKRAPSDDEYQPSGHRHKMQPRGDRERREQAVSPQELEKKIDEFCRRHVLEEKVRKMMCNMFQEDVVEILRMGSQTKEARNPTGFVISQIRSLEQKAGRPMGMRTHEHNDRDERTKQSRGPGGARGGHCEAQHGHAEIRPRASSGRQGFERSEQRLGKPREAKAKACRQSRTPPPRRVRARSDGDRGDGGYRCHERSGCDSRRLPARPSARGGMARSHR